MAKAISGNKYVKKASQSGLAAKTKTSNNKSSKLYKKTYRGQGK
jgi:hypothetical protein